MKRNKNIERNYFTKKDFEKVVSYYDALSIERIKKMEKLIEEGIIERIMSKEIVDRILKG
jgi:hypothetical protein